MSSIHDLSFVGVVLKNIQRLYWLGSAVASFANIHILLQNTTLARIGLELIFYTLIANEVFPIILLIIYPFVCSICCPIYLTVSLIFMRSPVCVVVVFSFISFWSHRQFVSLWWAGTKTFDSPQLLIFFENGLKDNLDGWITQEQLICEPVELPDVVSDVDGVTDADVDVESVLERGASKHELWTMYI